MCHQCVTEFINVGRKRGGRVKEAWGCGGGKEIGGGQKYKKKLRVRES